MAEAPTFAPASVAQMSIPEVGGMIDFAPGMINTSSPEFSTPFVSSFRPELGPYAESITIADSLIMNNVLGPFDRRAQMSSYSHEVPVMKHELGHALLAMNGHSGEFTSRPGIDVNGNPYAGLTTIYDHMSDDEFNITAAGGYAVGGDGYGSDFQQIQERHIFGNGLSLEAAKQTAKARLDSYTDEEISRTAQLATFILHSSKLDSISFAMLPTILNRAKAELNIEASYGDKASEIYKFLGPYGDQERAALQNAMQPLLARPSNYRQIIDRADGSRYIAVVKDNVLVDYYESCPLCGGKHGSVDCNPYGVEVEQAVTVESYFGVNPAEAAREKIETTVYDYRYNTKPDTNDL